ncbi:hypothetical protein TRFO_29091 [Tritrichomonas foetus]|uniref:ATPase n=1 Tax=Tritrichomonas foetus TaxID=1144522 RepID=A0A1J4JWL0_9EUKA|nr:hypothetical protein TRFO_29091 [Tritrichomonas foetus]|eukprot:OHT03537.1 hypothetical protein TRFO_29091 [Tritrichomonas foetus]
MNFCSIPNASLAAISFLSLSNSFFTICQNNQKEFDNSISRCISFTDPFFGYSPIFNSLAILNYSIFMGFNPSSFLIFQANSECPSNFSKIDYTCEKNGQNEAFLEDTNIPNHFFSIYQKEFFHNYFLNFIFIVILFIFRNYISNKNIFQSLCQTSYVKFIKISPVKNKKSQNNSFFKFENFKIFCKKLTVSHILSILKSYHRNTKNKTSTKIEKYDYENGDYSFSKKVTFPILNFAFEIDFQEHIKYKNDMFYNIKIPAYFTSDETDTCTYIDTFIRKEKNKPIHFFIQGQAFKITFRQIKSPKSSSNMCFMNISIIENMMIRMTSKMLNMTGIDDFKDYINEMTDIFAFTGIGFFVFKNGKFEEIVYSGDDLDVKQSLIKFMNHTNQSHITNLQVQMKTTKYYRYSWSIVNYKTYKFGFATVRSSDLFMLRVCEKMFISIFSHFVPIIWDTLFPAYCTANFKALSYLTTEHDRVAFLYSDGIKNKFITINEELFKQLTNDVENISIFYNPNHTPNHHPTHNQVENQGQDKKVFDITSKLDFLNSLDANLFNKQKDMKYKSKNIPLKSKRCLSSRYSQNESISTKRPITFWLVGPVKNEKYHDEIDFASIENLIFFDKNGNFEKNGYGFQTTDEFQNFTTESVILCKSKLFYSIIFPNGGGSLVEFVPNDNNIDPIIYSGKDKFTVWVINIQDLSIVWTVSNELAFSFSHDQCSISTLECLYSICHPDDLKNLSESIEHLKVVTSMSLSVKMRLKLYSEDYEWYQIHLIRKSSHYIIIYATYIHEYKNQVKLFREIDEQILTGMVYGNVICWYFEDTHTPSRIYNGTMNPSQTLEFNWTTIKYNIISDAQDMLTDVLRKALTDNQSFSVECPVIFDQFHYLYIRGVYYGRPGHLIGISVDITALKEASDKAIIAKKCAEEALNAKTQFLLSMSHEIRTPLFGISSLIKLLVSTSFTSEQQQMLDIVRNSFNRLMELLNDTLDLAKIEQGKMDTNIVKFEPLRILSDIIRPFYQQNHGKILIPRSSPSLPLLYRGDPHFLSRIVYNLLSNALKFTEAGGTVEVTMISDEEDNLIVKVKDTGIGILPEDQHRIFDVFTQGDTSITRPYGGIGVGLALVKKMLDLLNGKLTLRSKVGVGSTFKITIPFEPLYTPYFPPSLKNHHFQVLMLVHDSAISATQPFADFNGLTIIRDFNEIILDKLVIIVFTDYKYHEKCLKYKKLNQKITILYVIRSTIQAIKGALETSNHHSKTLNQENMNENTYHESEVNVSIDQIDQSIIVRKTPFPLSFVSNFFKNCIFAYISHTNGTGSPRIDDKLQKIKKFSNVNVLVVDDNIMNQLVLTKILSRLDCSYAVAENGIEAISRLRERPFDIAFFDRNMPIMDGPSTAKNIRDSGENYSKIPIIAMTASVMEEDEKECLDAGMNFFITKPLSVSKVTDCISRALSLKNKQ